MIVLEILKWIGIIVLYLLLILLGILLLVLFLPIKYYGEGTYNEEHKYAYVKARWFWGLIRVKACFPQKPYLSVKLLWIELLKDKAESSQDMDSEPPTEEAAEVSENTEAPSAPKTESKEEIKETQSVKTDSAEPEILEETNGDEKAAKEPILDKWIGIKEKIQYYIEVLNERDTKDVITHCKKRLIKILKSIRPRKLTFKGIVGFKTPDATGYLYGGYCMVSSYLGKNVILIPDFENEIIDVTGNFQGRITIFVLGWNALRVYLDKRLMRLIAKLKKGGR